MPRIIKIMGTEAHMSSFFNIFQIIISEFAEIFSIPEFISCFKIIFQPIRAQGRVALINKEIDQRVAAEEMNNK
jgi:hypothetical protein